MNGSDELDFSAEMATAMAELSSARPVTVMLADFKTAKRGSRGYAKRRAII